MALTLCVLVVTVAVFLLATLMDRMLDDGAEHEVEALEPVTFWPAAAPAFEIAGTSGAEPHTPVDRIVGTTRAFRRTTL